MYLYVFSSIFARQRLGKHASAATNTPNEGRFVFYAIHIVSKESLWICPSTQFVARQRLGKPFQAAKEDLLEALISMWSVTYQMITLL
jgi:hypothetical protein